MTVTSMLIARIHRVHIPVRAKMDIAEMDKFAMVRNNKKKASPQTNKQANKQTHLQINNLDFTLGFSARSLLCM